MLLVLRAPRELQGRRVRTAPPGRLVRLGRRVKRAPRARLDPPVPRVALELLDPLVPRVTLVPPGLPGRLVLPDPPVVVAVRWA